MIQDFVRYLKLAGLAIPSRSGIPSKIPIEIKKCEKFSNIVEYVLPSLQSWHLHDRNHNAFKFLISVDSCPDPLYSTRSISYKAAMRMCKMTRLNTLVSATFYNVDGHCSKNQIRNILLMSSQLKHGSFSCISTKLSYSRDLIFCW